MIFINKNIGKMRAIVNETQYKKILIEKRKEYDASKTWASYTADIMLSRIVRLEKGFNEDVFTEKNLINKLRAQEFSNKLPIDSIIFNVFKNYNNIDNIEVDIDYNPYWTSLVEDDRGKSYIIDAEFDVRISLPNSINELFLNEMHQKIVLKLTDQFMNVYKWLENEKLPIQLVEQTTPESYKLHTSDVMIPSYLDDDVRVLNKLFNDQIKKNIHITKLDGDTIYIDSSHYSKDEKYKMWDYFKKNNDLHMGIDKDYNMLLSFDNSKIESDIGDYGLRLEEFIINNNIKFFESSDWENMTLWSKYPIFKTLDDIPEGSKEFFKYVWIESPPTEDIPIINIFQGEGIPSVEMPRDDIDQYQYSIDPIEMMEVPSYLLNTVTVHASRIENAPSYIKTAVEHCKNNPNGCVDWKTDLVKIGKYKDGTGQYRKDGCEDYCKGCDPSYLFGCESHPYGDNAYLVPEAAKDFKLMNEKYKKEHRQKDLPLLSAYRDYFHQKILYDNKSRAQLVGKPGKSNHGLGKAIDVRSKAREWVKKNGEEFGFEWNLGEKDKNHFKYVGKTTPIVITNKKYDGKKTAFNEDVKNAIKKASQDYGISEKLLTDIARIESGGKWWAENKKSKAAGLYQILPRYFKSYGVTDETVWNPYINASTGAKKLNEKIKKLTTFLSRMPLNSEIYLSHQQGSAGFKIIYTACEDFPDLKDEESLIKASEKLKIGPTGEKIYKNLKANNMSNPCKALEKYVKKLDVEESKEEVQADPSLPRNFAKVPLGDDIYRSSQPTKGQLKYILENKDYNINTVMRLNGETAKGLSPKDEEKYVKSLGKKYIYINAHNTYKEGKGYTKSIENAKKPLEDGHILVHCTGGMDRTGYQIGKFLQDEGYGSKEDIWNYTIPFNRWEEYICTPPPHRKGKNYGYIKYMEAFYPLKEWCEEKKSRSECESCKKYGYTKK